MIDYLLYLSTAIHLLNEAELQNILTVSRQKNQQNNLSGILLYSEGTFIQLLEGDTDELTSTYNSIIKDRRHKNVMLLIEGETEERLFPDWTMGFKTINPEQLKMIAGYFDPKSLNFKADRKHDALAMIKTFKDSNPDL